MSYLYCTYHLIIFVFICITHSYQQYFDLEGESGIVVRGIGTAVVLTRLENPSRHQHNRLYAQKTSQVINSAPQTSKQPGTSEEYVNLFCFKIIFLSQSLVPNSDLWRKFQKK